MIHRFLAGITLAAFILAMPISVRAAESKAGDWPRWRGARFDGVATTQGGVFSKPFELRVRWRKSIGTGYSGVVIAEGHAVTMASDGKMDYVVSLDAKTGKENWRVLLAEAFPGRDGSTGGPVSTPAIDAGVAYALGPHGEFVAVRLKDGKTLWKRQIAQELGAVEPHWGFTTSPLVTSENVIVMTGGAPDKAVTAFDKRDGKVLWRAGSDAVNYGSPMLLDWEGRKVVLWGGDTQLGALDPRDGRSIWSTEHGGVGFYRFIINPVLVRPGEVFLTFKPDEAALIKLGEGGKLEQAWATKDMRRNYSTPVVHGANVFGYSGQFLTCVNAQTGELAWKSREPGDGWPIIVDGHLVVITRNQGRLVVAEATAKAFEEKAGLNVLDGLVWTPPAFAEGRIYVRDSVSDIAAVDIVPLSGNMRAGRAASGPGVAPDSQFAKWVAETEGKPDAAERVKQFLAQQKSFPIIEGERYAHIIYDGEGNDVAVRADPLEFVQELPMRRVAGTNLRYASFELAPDARITYQFVRNLTERIPDPRNPAQVPSLYYAEKSSLLLMPRATREMPPATPVAELRGKIVDLEIENKQVRAETLTWGGNKRKIWVYLPPGYDTESARRYPVLYVFNGADLLREARLDAALDREIAAGSMAPVIAVFVQTTSAYEYARTFRAPFRQMMAEQLVPWIDGQFRTVAQPAGRTLLGGDEGGFGALEIGVSHPEIFGNVMAQSGYPLSYGDRELFALIDRSSNKGQRFYLDWGRYDGRRKSDRIDMPAFMRATAERLKKRGYSVTTREFSDGGATPFWVQRIMPALREFFPLVK